MAAQPLPSWGLKCGHNGVLAVYKAEMEYKVARQPLPCGGPNVGKMAA